MSIWTKRNKLNQMALKKQMEFPELTCVEKIINPADKEKVLVDVGDVVRVERTENKSAEGKDLYLVGRKESGMLLLTKEEIMRHFDCKGVKMNEVPYHPMGFKIDESKVKKEENE